jgi:hypothetical protein
MTVRAISITHSRLWGLISGAAKVGIEREQGAAEFDLAPVAVGGRTVTARALMDALAARAMVRWEHTERNGYRLLVPRAELDFVYVPHNEHERERSRLGEGVIDYLNGLPAADQGRLRTGLKTPFSGLPPAIRNLVEGMLETRAAENRERGGGPTVYGGDLSTASVGFQREAATGFSSFWVSVRVPGLGSSGFTINDYGRQQMAREAERRKGVGPDDLYEPRKFEVTREAAKLLPELMQKVDFNAGKVAFPEAMAMLHQKYGIAYVSDPVRAMPQRAEVRLAGMTLGDALDTLCKTFTETEWEWRKYGFVVIRGPSNPAREPTQGRTSGTASK